MATSREERDRLRPLRPGVVHRRPRRGDGTDEGQFAVAADAFGIGTVERQTGEELGGHAAALAGVVAAAAAHAPADCGSRSSRNRSLCCQTCAKPAAITHRSGLELVVDHERAGVHVADRVDEAHDAPGATHVETGQRLAERVEVEERVAGQHLLAVGEQPFVDLALLGARRVQLVPRVGAAAATGAAG